ncbi:unnamed protein product [Rotaria sp. Silwood2]|nr:unnamed protein product [Rotaria sp. Silwood2]CAF2595671.1 unnamed protein product [Rotaria sp. Silwood2]CAF2863817.1 unnamed protein product [Rotaria sp. Silwood2]CAF3003038.1 unnamed protein product [Rotaria sp. Silwood2]CAF4046196.1 unnamed protein product [Rotaria sp. Silwood2]
MNSTPKISCCLICSILSSLSNINCCPKHLTLLNKTLSSNLSTPIIYMMPSTVNDWSKLDCHCRSHCSKSKRRRRSRSSSSSSSLSSSSSKSRQQKRKQSKTIQSNDAIHKDNVTHSSSREENASFHIAAQEISSVYQQHRSNHVRTPLSPLFRSSSLINTNMDNKNKKLQKKKKISSTPIATKPKERNIDRIESIVQYESLQSNHQRINKQLQSPVYAPRILLNRVVHVKDEGEALFTNNRQMTLNMAQATEQMIVQKDLKPRILLQRVSL